jgi:hypothetical protein
MGDDSGILALGLGLDGGILDFPPHSWPSRLRYNPDTVCAANTIHVVIGPRSSPWETAAAS